MLADFDTSEATGPESTQVIVGDPVTLSCVVPASYPPAEMNMLRDRKGHDLEVVENKTGFKVYSSHCLDS